VISADEIVAADTSVGRFSLAVSDAVNEGAGAVSPFKAAQPGHIVASELVVTNGSRLTLKLLPTSVTPVGRSWSTDSTISSIGTIQRCSRIGGFVGTSHPTKRRHPTVAADAILKRFIK